MRAKILHQLCQSILSRYETQWKVCFFYEETPVLITRLSAPSEKAFPLRFCQVITAVQNIIINDYLLYMLYIM